MPGRVRASDLPSEAVAQLLNQNPQAAPKPILRKPGKGAASRTPQASPQTASRPQSARDDGKMAAVLIDNWHVKPDGCVWQGTTEHSSRVVNVNGRFFQTRSQNWYILGTVNPRIAEVCQQVGFPVDPDAPLKNLEAMLYAEKVVYGPVSPAIERCLSSLATMQTHLGSPHTQEQFDTIFRALNLLGIQTTSAPSSPSKQSH